MPDDYLGKLLAQQAPNLLEASCCLNHKTQKAMKVTIIPLLLVLAFAAGACEKSQETEFTLGKSFELDNGARAVCTCGEVSLRFMRVVEDSRCPYEVECVWAGRVVLEIEVEAGGSSHTLTLSSANNESQATAGGYLVTMGEVTPYPVSTDTIPASAYKVTLTVTEL